MLLGVIGSVVQLEEFWSMCIQFALQIFFRAQVTTSYHCVGHPDHYKKEEKKKNMKKNMKKKAVPLGSDAEINLSFHAKNCGICAAHRRATRAEVGAWGASGGRHAVVISFVE